MANDIMTDAVTEISRHIVREKERALIGTDFDEWDIVDLVEYDPQITSSDDRFSFGETEVHRYKDRAPPLDTYADGRRPYSVQRVTKPLFDKLQDELLEDTPD